MVLVVKASLGHWCGACCYQLSRNADKKRREEESHPFYLRAGGACFLYIHCQALPAPSHSCFRRCAAGRLPSGPGLLPSGLGGAVPVRCCFGMLPSGNVPLRANMHLHDTYPMHPYRLRVTYSLSAASRGSPREHVLPILSSVGPSTSQGPGTPRAPSLQLHWSWSV